MAGGAAEPVRRTVSRASGLLVFVLVGILVGAGGAVAWMWIRAIAFPFPLDYGEGPLLDHALRLARGAPVYTVPGGEPPWTVLNYPPVYPILNAGLSELFGPAFWYGRVVSVIAALGAAVFAGLIVVAITGSRTAAVITALLMPVVPCLGFWASLARVDSVALALSLVGLWCTVRRPESRRWLVAAAVVMALAACTRQSYLLAAPLTAAVWLGPHGRGRALAFVGGVVGLVGAGWMIMTVVTAGGFWFDIVRANVNDYDLDLLVWYAEGILWTVPVLLAALVVALVVTVRWRLRSARFLIPYSAAAVVVFATAGKVGSSLNYLLELGTAACLAAGFLLAALGRRPRWRAVVLIALMGQTLFVWLVPHPYYGLLDRAMANRVAGERIAAVVAESDGPVLADEDSGFLPLSGRPIELQPFELSQLAYAGLWDQTPLLQAIGRHRYGTVLIYENDDGLEEYRWTPEMLAAIRETYRVAETIQRDDGRTVIYRPR